MKLFIVEDSTAVLERLMRSIAEVPGVAVVGSALDVKPAILGLEEKRPDALILDLHLPGGNGLEVLKAVRKSQPTLRVMVFTNFSAEPYRRAAMEAGAEEFLDKNADFPRVGEILRRWLAGAPAITTTH